MNRTLGATCITCVLAVAGFVAMGTGGYMTMTGQTLCSVVGGCGDKAAKSTDTDKKIVTVANNEKSEKKSCCALKATAAKNKEGCTSEANVVAASAKEGCSAEKKAACGSEAATVAVNTKESSGCCKAKAEAAVKAVAAKEGCSAEKKAACGSEAAAVAVNAKEGCSAAKAACAASKSACSGKKAAFVMMNASYPIAMPAMFFNAEAKVTPISFKEAGGCSDAAKVACASAPSACCKAKKEGVAMPVAATEKASGCCKAKAEAAVKAVAAKEASDAGCCKGTGVRADGQACKNDGEHCKKACDDKKAETKAGEPVASR